jgi:hypothetical protein
VVPGNGTLAGGTLVSRGDGIVGAAGLSFTTGDGVLLGPGMGILGTCAFGDPGG